MNRKIAILIVDFPYISYDFFKTISSKSIEIFMVDYPYYAYDSKGFTDVTLVSLKTEKGSHVSHLNHCESANKCVQDELYLTLGKFTDLIIITEFGGLSYGSLNCPKICENLFYSGKNIYLLFIQASKFIGRGRNAMGKIALDSSSKYVTRHIELPSVDYFCKKSLSLEFTKYLNEVISLIRKEIHKIVNVLAISNTEKC